MDLYHKVKEMTTSGDIAFARGGSFRDITPEERKVLKFGKFRLKDMTEEEIQEQIDSKSMKLKDEVVKEIDRIIGSTKLTFERFHQIFGGRPIDKEVALINFHRYESALENILKGLPNDVGDLELTLNALKDKRGVGFYEPFDKKSDLFSAQFVAAIDGIRITYIGRIDMNLIENETITISDIKKAEIVADEHSSVKRAKGTLYPVGGIFSKEFYKNLKYTIQKDEEK